MKISKISQRIPQNLSEARVNWCKVLSKTFDRGTAKFVYIITGDETLMYSYEPETQL